MSAAELGDTSGPKYSHVSAAAEQNSCASLTERAAVDAEAALRSPPQPASTVKTLYLDHNLCHYFVHGFPDAQLERDDRAAL